MKRYRKRTPRRRRRSYKKRMRPRNAPLVRARTFKHKLVGVIPVKSA